MRTERLSARWCLAVGLGLAGAALGCSDGAGDGGDGTTGGAQATGGAATGGSGGAETAGGTGTGGVTGSGGQPVTGGTTTGGVGPASGGSAGTGGTPGTGGASTGGTATGGTATGGAETGGLATGGAETGGAETGGAETGGAETGGAETGGSETGGAEMGGAATGGAEMGGAETGGAETGGAETGGVETGGAETGGSATGGEFTGTCTASVGTGTRVSGSGPYEVVVETNSDPGINEGTIYRPAELGGADKVPIFVWGNGACERKGTANSAAMGEIASHGYFVVADGKPNGGDSNIPMSSDYVGMAAPLLAYITWAIEENEKPCSAYYQSLDTSKVAANGFSCGGLMASGTSGDPRMTTYGITSSGLTGASQAFYAAVHTPVLVILGGPSDIAYENGERDYDSISALGHPIMLFSKDIGHGGDLWDPNGGDFTRINLAWLNWWMKGDEGATGKGVLVGDGCTYCRDSAWEVKSSNLP